MWGRRTAYIQKNSQIFKEVWILYVCKKKKKNYRKVQLYSKKVKKHKLHAIKINKVFTSINVCLISNLVNTKASITKISERKFITIFIHVYGHLWIHVKVTLKYRHVEWMVTSNWACWHSWVKHLVVKGHFELFLEPSLVSGLKGSLAWKKYNFSQASFVLFPPHYSIRFQSSWFFFGGNISFEHTAPCFSDVWPLSLTANILSI